jgi:putative Holliday junction resolvase
MARLGRRIAFDYGDVRIGVAICDPDGLLATPLEVLQSKDPNLLVKINELVQEYEPVKFYVGEPKQLNGVDSVAAEKAMKFAERLSAKFDIEISMIDERLSTVSASRQLRDAGIDAKSPLKVALFANKSAGKDLSVYERWQHQLLE